MAIRYPQLLSETVGSLFNAAEFGGGTTGFHIAPRWAR
jgi:hypothetical protein